MNFFAVIGKYVLLMRKTFTIPDSWKLFLRQYVLELEKQGIGSLSITLIISIFIGAVMTVQIVLDISNPLLPSYITGLATRDTLLLEFSSTILALILAGKVGSNIASEIGAMRITEQIDALEIMGVNSANYLILPRIIAFATIVPILVLFSMFFGLTGGYLVAMLTDMITIEDYVYGIQYAFVPFYVTYSIIKSIFFAFLISSISSFYGYHVSGGALEVGKASTDAVVKSSVMVLISNLILTKLLLS